MTRPHTAWRSFWLWNFSLDSSLTALDVVGQEHEEGQRYVPEMLISAEAMKASLLKLKPL